MSTSTTTPATPANPYPEGFDHGEWRYFGYYARMIEWTAGAVIIALAILIGLPFFCIIALPVLVGYAVANLPVSGELVLLIVRLKGKWPDLFLWKNDWKGDFIKAVVVPRIYRTLGILLCLMFPLLLSWSVNSRIDMVVAKRIALVEETLGASQKTVDDVLASMRKTQLDSCNMMAQRKMFSGNCDLYVQQLGQNLTAFLEANEHHPSYDLFQQALQSVNNTHQELAEIRSRVLPNPGILQIIFDLLPACLDSIQQQTSRSPVVGMFLTLGFLMALFELLYRYGPWIQHRYPLLRATWVASGLFLLAGTVLLYLSNVVIVWPDVSKIIDLKYGLQDSYEQTLHRLEELQSSRGMVDYYLSLVISIGTSVSAFIAIALGTYITGKKSMAMYLVGIFLFFLAAEAQFYSLTQTAKHFSVFVLPVLALSGLLLAYDHLSATH
jgi:hypothetical protein